MKLKTKSRTTIDELQRRRVGRMTAAERTEFDNAYASAKLAIAVGEQVRNARTAAAVTQRELAARMGTSQAAVARLEAGGAAATLTTLQRAASALGLDLSVRIGPPR